MTPTQYLAFNRLGLGARFDQLERPNKIEAVATGLITQLKTFNVITPPQYHSSVILKQLAILGKKQKSLIKAEKKEIKKRASNDESNQNSSKKAPVERPQIQYSKQVFKTLAQGVVTEQIDSKDDFAWRIFDFFSNHFSVTAKGSIMRALAPTLEREAIAPHLNGQFETLLIAAVKHPAMLYYLNNERSFGPNSKLGKKGKGLNENLAREICELHTLGVKGGYTQQDVISLAKGISGWSVSRAQNAGFKFKKAGHEPGTQRFLGVDYPQQGERQGEAMLKALAIHPNTANFICRKLVRHVVDGGLSDMPLEKLVNSMVKMWLATKGHIPSVVEVMLQPTSAVWQADSKKYKTPRELYISVYRLLAHQGIKPKPKNMLKDLSQLGQRPFNAQSPAGFSDDKNDWISAAAMITRVDWTSNLAEKKSKKLNIKALVDAFFPTQLSELTYRHVVGAGSRVEALTLLLMSPEFQTR